MTSNIKWFNIGFGIGLLFLIWTMVSATADQPSVMLSQGQAAPYAGTLIDTARAIRIDDLKLQYDHLVVVDSLKDEDNNVLNQRLSNATKENNDLNSRLTAQDSHTHLYEVGMFILGAGVTGLVSYGVFRAAH